MTVQAVKDTKKKRRLLLGGVFALFLLAGVGYALYYFLHARFHETTDDAYVTGNLIQITPQIAGTVLSIHADDTEYVPSGKSLVSLDKADAQILVSQAEAQLAKTVRSVRNLRATSTEGEANVTMRQAELRKAQQDLARRRSVEPAGAVSGEELQHAVDSVNSARAALDAAQKQLEAQRAMVDRTDVHDHPDVLAAAAKVREAYLALARTEVPAPTAGFVARRSVQVGQRVAPGNVLMTVTPLADVWVDANFKENQLATLRPGQPVTLEADAYGGSVEFHGRVAGFSPGTGGAFALLPAQNASGNWIKVVQRVPVRIALDPKELDQHPLQIGLSMKVDVDTHDRSAGRLARVERKTPAYETTAFAPADPQTDARIEQIIVANTNGAALGASARH
ncbi:MAG: efflux RND transporter periplasmic adaptor subunit [Betaproteobacteria bacterium]|nr:efflux RND transporter periplasmic adaptor subunit [Betaproteobacteria bacterium]MBV9362163.1 efflux RND transporter periplasmic adaptor subunit [Betaproteobacteria bacterium]